MKSRNPHATALRSATFAARKVKPRKGKGSFSRKAKHRKQEI